jgi:hypothetical protein
MKKWMLLLAFAAGYVLGAKAGRERYEQISKTFHTVSENPHVQSAAAQVATTAKEGAPVVADKVTGLAGTAKEKVAERRHAKDEDDLVEELHPDSTARQEDPYPKGDLP